MVTSTGATLVAQFDRMVQADGGRVTLVGETPEQVHVRYTPGEVPQDCPDGVCVMPGAELRELMTETLRRRSTTVQLVLEVDQ